MRAAPLLLAALLLAPLAGAAPPPPDYPPEMRALLPGWIAEAEALVREGDREAAWWPEAESFLERAKDADEAGRLRVAMFHLETFSELVVAQHLMEDARGAGSDSEQRAAILQQTRAWHEEAHRAWLAFRERLHGFDGEIRSVATLERALYAADVALVAATTLAEHDLLAPEFPKQSGVPEGYVLALVRSSHSARLAIERADELLTVAAASEGVPPVIDGEAWANVTQAALGVEGEAPPYLETIDALAMPARNNSETTMAVAFLLAEQRATRAYSMQTIFGDAESRGLAVVQDAARGMNKQLNNTTLETPRSHGLSGVFTSDAIDRAMLTNELLAAGNASLGTVIVAWSALEHASYATSTLATVSPVEPEAPRETPFAGVLVALAALLIAARRR